MAKDVPPGLIPADLRTLRPVMQGPIPEILFVASAKIRPDMAAALRARFETAGIELVGQFASDYYAHLAYSQSIADQFYEAGYSADFSEALFIYQTDNRDEAEALFRADPFHANGVFEDVAFFDWEIHPPLFKGHFPPMPEQVVDIAVDVATPEVLIASFGSFDLEAMGNWKPGDERRPWHQLLHMINMYGDGGLANMGLVWAAGPTLDMKGVLHLLAVPTIEMAQWANQLDAMYRWGVVRDFRYFEWCIHYPLSKATRRRKLVLEAMIAAHAAS